MIDLFPYIVYTIPVAFGLSFFLTVFSLPYIVHVARKHNILVYPNHRDIHKGGIPRMGGVAIFLSIVFSLVFFSGVNTILYFRTIFTGVFILFFFGLYDDLMDLRPWKKIVGEIVASLLVIIGAQMRFTNIYGFLGIHELGLIPSILVTVFVFVAIINAFNLIDGIDGLAAGLAIEAAIVYGFFFFIDGAFRFTILAAILTGTLAAFFYFNVWSKKNKIFMGDSGSLVVGLLIGLMTWRFNELMLQPGIPVKLNAAPAIAMGIITVPLYDTLRVMLVRIIKKKPFFLPDQIHIHHILLHNGFSQTKVRRILLAFNFFMILVSLLLQYYIHSVLLIILILLLICLVSTYPAFKMSGRKILN
ncbi:MAG TPA: MraY family glycosyltransferase [Bacteroidales bacterium]|nr:MraY family glycosyltransferase [Bacteroidales bacterium]